MIRISPVELGLPVKIGTQLSVRINSFSVDAETAVIIYNIKSDIGEILLGGRLELTPEQYTSWGEDNEYIVDIVLTYLGLTREVTT